MTDSKWWRMRVTIALSLYFAILAVSGVVGIILISNLDSPFILWNSYPVALSYYAANTVVGTGGLLSIITRTRRGEFLSLVCLSILAVGASILLMQTALPLGIGLMASPLLLLSLGWLRRQLVLADIYRLNHLLEDHPKTDPDTGEPPE